MRISTMVRSAFPLCIAVVAAISSRAAAEDPCHLSIVAKLPMTVLQSGRVGVPMSVDGKSLTMLVDTGAIGSMLTPESVARLGLIPNPLTSMANVRLYGGVKIDHYVIAHNIALGRLQAGNFVFFISPPGRFRPDEEGLLAPDILSGFDLEFDFANASLSLLKPNECDGVPVYWTRDPYAQIDISLNALRRMTIPVTIDGREFKAVVDTGATGTLASLERVEDKFGIDEKNLKRIEGNKPEYPRYRYPFKALSFEGVSVNNPDIVLVSDVQSKEYGGPEILLGMNVLRELHMYIAYRKHKIYVTPASAH